MVLALSFAAVLPLVGQDVTVAPLEWLEPKDAPDQFPVENHRLKPEFPADLRKTPEVGYVVLEFFTDERGQRLSLQAVGTLTAFEEAVTAATRTWKHKPGRRAGQAVNTVTTCTVIFNPASASPKPADATPRLLAAGLVVDPKRVTGKKEPRIPPEVVWVTVHLDEHGTVVTLKDPPDGLAEQLEQGVRRFSFSPARRAGQPVAADLRVPIIIVPPGNALAGEITPPRVIRQQAPVYPVAMNASGLRGEVLVDFVVDVEGRVTNAYVERSLNPAFDEPALTALRRWKFEPGRRGGVPVAAHMRVPIYFELTGHVDGGDSGIEVKGKGNRPELPPEFRYDVPPKPRGTLRPIYPYELLRADTSGKARVRFVVGANGQVIYAKVDSADRPEFGAALLAAIEGFEFEPALKDGRPTQALFAMEQKFSRYDTDGVVTREDRDLLETEHKHPERIVAAGKLDAPLRPISRRPPAFPLSLNGVVESGEAVIEFLIDDEGYVRLPRVVSATKPEFGWSAVQAVAVWRFEAPQSGGRSANTRVRVPFKFNGPPVAPTPKPEPGK